MRITGNIGAAGRPGRVQNRYGQSVTMRAENERNYDQVSIESENSFRKQLQSRLSQEIRTATTTGTVASLREQVQSGEYQVDTAAIARRLLFVWEA